MLSTRPRAEKDFPMVPSGSRLGGADCVDAVATLALATPEVVVPDPTWTKVRRPVGLPFTGPEPAGGASSARGDASNG